MIYSWKKVVFYSIVVVIILGFIVLFRSGVKLGSVRIGNQSDLLASQDYDVENSRFYKDYYTSDSLLVLNYWATWCKPCITEMPTLNEVKRLYKGKEKVAFISFSMDTDSLRLIEFLSTGTFEYIDLTLTDRSYRTAILNMLRGKFPDEWIGSYSLPLTFLVKDKNVIQVWEGTIEKGMLIEEIEKNKPPAGLSVP